MSGHGAVFVIQGTISRLFGTFQVQRACPTRMTNSRFSPLSVLLLALTVGGAFCQAPVEARAKKIVQVLQLHPGSVVADVGAGDGEWSVELARAVAPGGRVFATEVSDDVLAKLRKTVERSGLDSIEIVRGDQLHTGLEADCCDAVLLRHVYHHFARPESMLADLLASLRPGGLFAVIDFSPDNGLSRTNVPEFRHGHGVRPENVAEEVRRSGFKLVRKEDRWDGRDFLLLFQKPAGF